MLKQRVLVVCGHDVFNDIVPGVPLNDIVILLWVPALLPGINSVSQATPHQSLLHRNSGSFISSQLTSSRVDTNFGG